MFDEAARRRVVSEVKSLMLEAGLARPEAIRRIVASSAWSLPLYMAKDRKTSNLGASSAQIARWCDEADVAPSYFRDLVVSEIQRRGGSRAIPTLAGDARWRNILLASRAKGVDGVPSERTMQRWFSKAERRNFDFLRPGKAL